MKHLKQILFKYLYIIRHELVDLIFRCFNFGKNSGAEIHNQIVSMDKTWTKPLFVLVYIRSK